jgi:hypothetical protein
MEGGVEVEGTEVELGLEEWEEAPIRKGGLLHRKRRFQNNRRKG